MDEVVSSSNVDHFKLETLAKPKPVSKGFVQDRRSVYWVDKLPPQPPTTFALSPRLEEMVKSKKYHKDFKPDRPTPIWPVSSAALEYSEKPRLNTLSKPKQFHQQWTPDRPVYTEVNEAAKNAVATKRLCELAKNKHYDPLLIKSNSSWEWGEWKTDVPKESLTHVASSRLEQLAETKPIPKDYQDNRPVMWPVPQGAKNAQPSNREHQLARPKTRIALDQDYDPYKVTFAAKNAVASPRVDELCKPIPRKVRVKK